MNNSSVLYVRMDGDLKKKAESVLSKLGITPSNAVSMLYSQIAMTESFPLDLSVKENKLRCFEDMNEEEIGHLLDESLDSLKHDRLYSAKEVEEELTRKLGL